MQWVYSDIIWNKNQLITADQSTIFGHENEKKLSNEKNHNKRILETLYKTDLRL